MVRYGQLAANSQYEGLDGYSSEKQGQVMWRKFQTLKRYNPVPIAKRCLPILMVLVGLALVGIALWGIYNAALAAWRYLSGVPKEVIVALIAASATVFVSTLTVVIGRYFERKKELDALYRDKKVEIYDEFLQRFFKMFYREPNVSSNIDPPGHSDEMVTFLQEFIRKLVLWSGPEVIKRFVTWKQQLASSEPNTKTIFVTEEFLLALRRDLRHRNKGIPKGFLAHFLLREADLFLAAARNNPNITLAEISALEAALRPRGRDNES
jgi:hypothetical protein